MLICPRAACKPHGYSPNLQNKPHTSELERGCILSAALSDAEYDLFVVDKVLLANSCYALACCGKGDLLDAPLAVFEILVLYCVIPAAGGFYQMG